MFRKKMKLTPEHLQQVNEAIKRCVAQTSARILVVITRSSGRYERAEDMVGLWGAALGLSLVWAIISMQPTPLVAGGQIWRLGFIPIIGVLIGGFILGAMLATQIGTLRRLFVPRKHLQSAALSRAKQIYNEQRAENPRDAEKIFLVFFTLYEEAAVIQASDAIDKTLDSKSLDQMRHELVCDYKQGRLADRLEAVVTRLSQTLTEKFPPISSESSASNLIVID